MPNETAVAVTPVAPAFATAEQYLAILNELQVGNITTLAGWHRVDFAKGVRVYIARSKTIKVIALAGFEAPMTLATLPPQGKYGTVTQHVNIEGLTPDVQLANFRACVELAIAAPTTVKVKAPAEKKAKAEKAVAGLTPEEQAARHAADAEAKAERLALIKKIAAEKKVAISASVA